MAFRPLDPPVVTVRFKPGRGPPFDPVAANQAMPSLQGATWSALQALFPGIQILPRVRASATQLQALVDQAQQLTPSYQPLRFAEMFHIQLPPTAAWQPGSPDDPQDPQRGAKLAHLMRTNLPIDRVTVQLAPTRLAVDDPPAGGGSGLLMHHLDVAPKGVGVAAVSGMSGGKGEGEILTDVEKDWQTSHREFTYGGTSSTPLSIVAVPGNLLTIGAAANNDLDDAKHGTNCLSVAVARINQEKGLGVAPEAAKALLASAFEPSDAADLGDAIVRALLELLRADPGSVLMIPCEISAEPFVAGAPVGYYTDVYGPCEMDEDVFDFIQLAVALHVIVVEAAGNGNKSDKSLSLDAHPEVLHGDSGAILVGGSEWLPDNVTAPASGRHEPRYPFTTGDRIDCFAWGNWVYAASTLSGKNSAGALYYSDFYRTDFGGTSSATSIIAGVALVVQSLTRKNIGTYQPPMQMRLLLGDRSVAANNTRCEYPTGTPVTNRIGVMPNLAAIASKLGVRANLYIRDNVLDDGGIHDGVLCESPDIIVRIEPYPADAVAAFGEGSGTEDDDDLSQSPVHGDAAKLYVRVRNRGGQDALKAIVTVYWADSAVILLPPSWHEIGQIEVDVPAGDTIVVAGPIDWPVVDATGHNCFIATVHHDQDPVLLPADLRSWDQFKALVRNNNNVAWRNFDVIKFDETEKMSAMWTDVGGEEGGDDQDVELRIEANLPSGATLAVSLPEELAARLSLAHGTFKKETVNGKRRVRCKLPAHRTSSLGRVRLKPDDKHQVQVHVEVPESLRKRSYEIRLIQLHRGTPLGGHTWRLVPKKRT